MRRLVAKFVAVFITMSFYVIKCIDVNALQVSNDVIYKGFKSDGYHLQIFHQSVVDFDDAVMLITGPQASSMVWKKDKKFGMWINSESQFIPYYHSVIKLYSTADLNYITSDYNIKLLNLNFFDELVDNELYQFFLQYQILNGFYSINNSAFNIKNNVLLQDIILPSQSPVGGYKIHLYLFKDFNVIYAAQTEFELKNNTVFYRINRAAHRHPVKYALVAIIIALLFGWKAAFFFRKLKSR